MVRYNFRTSVENTSAVVVDYDISNAEGAIWVGVVADKDLEVTEKAFQGKQLTFPFVKIAVYVNKTDSAAPKGTVTFADLPKK